MGIHWKSYCKNKFVTIKKSYSLQFKQHEKNTLEIIFEKQICHTEFFISQDIHQLVSNWLDMALQFYHILHKKT